MVLNVPKIADKMNVFKDSPGLNSVLKSQGGRRISKADDDTNTQTKEFWVTGAGGLAGTIGDFYVRRCLMAGNYPVYLRFKVPHDFNSITSAEVILIPGTNNATADVDIYSDYAAEGETYNTHSEDDTASTYNLTANQIYALNVSGILSSIAANDFVGIKILMNPAEEEIKIIGFRLRYT